MSSMSHPLITDPYGPLPGELPYGDVPCQVVLFDVLRWYYGETSPSYNSGAGGEWGTPGYQGGFDRDYPFNPADFSWLCGGVPMGNGGGTTIFQLRDGIERFVITDINNPGVSAKSQSDIAVFSDNISLYLDRYNHVPGGSNVLFMDGHVEFKKYPSTEFPVNEGYARFMGRL